MTSGRRPTGTGVPRRGSSKHPPPHKTVVAHGQLSAIIMIALARYPEDHMAQVLVRDLDKTVIERLKTRAQQHGRSLQVEFKTILEQAARSDLETARRAAERLRRKLAGRKVSDSPGTIAED